MEYIVDNDLEDQLSTTEYQGTGLKKWWHTTK